MTLQCVHSELRLVVYHSHVSAPLWCCRLSNSEIQSLASASNSPPYHFSPSSSFCMRSQPHALVLATLFPPPFIHSYSALNVFLPSSCPTYTVSDGEDRKSYLSPRIIGPLSSSILPYLRNHRELFHARRFQLSEPPFFIWDRPASTSYQCFAVTIGRLFRAVRHLAQRVS